MQFEPIEQNHSKRSFFKIFQYALIKTPFFYQIKFNLFWNWARGRTHKYFYHLRIIYNFVPKCEINFRLFWRMLKPPPVNPRAYISRYPKLDPREGR